MWKKLLTMLKNQAKKKMKVTINYNRYKMIFKKKKLRLQLKINKNKIILK